jgi:hypothetical protein
MPVKIAKLRGETMVPDLNAQDERIKAVEELVSDGKLTDAIRNLIAFVA